MVDIFLRGNNFKITLVTISIKNADQYQQG